MSDTTTQKKVAKLVMVTDAGVRGNNKYYNMSDNGDGTFTVKYGRVEGNETEHTYPMHEWDKKLKSKTKKGYKDVTDLYVEVEETSTDGKTTQADIQDKVVKKLMDQLQNFANKTIQKNYRVSTKAVTQVMVDEAQGIVDRIASAAKVGREIAPINKDLMALFAVIPRRMHSVKDHLIYTGEDNEIIKITRANKKEILKLVENEQDTLDVMAGQVMQNTSKAKDDEDTPGVDHDILAMMGLTITEGTAKDYKIVKELMDYQDKGKSSKCKKVFKVTNAITEKKFKAWLSKQDDKTVKRYWHGSRNQNWLNIMQTGLLIRPAGAIHTGSMFGDGIYGANKAQKSINYSSLRGSYWSGGSDNVGYLALFKFHVGKEQKIKHHNSSHYKLDYKKVKADGYDSVYAQGGADLRNDEFIVYKSEQVTIEYLVEIG